MSLRLCRVRMKDEIVAVGTASPGMVWGSIQQTLACNDKKNDKKTH